MSKIVDLTVGVAGWPSPLCFVPSTKFVLVVTPSSNLAWDGWMSPSEEFPIEWVVAVYLFYMKISIYESWLSFTDPFSLRSPGHTSPLFLNRLCHHSHHSFTVIVLRTHQSSKYN
ncbi:hypothetical protein CRG98_035145 [Punica granatum]|uniref:Uncharacterized protein n=1 Tax=Punica granatum TaxID=22663 RepID=A0A2I0IKD6_PUNGR|nr:hypothetical protein CRG98_035145 [Punica granatum]